MCIEKEKMRNWSLVVQEGEVGGRRTGGEGAIMILNHETILPVQ